MSVLEGVLNEEIKRLESNILAYNQMLALLPRGTIFIRKIHNNSFVYRKRKENGKVISEYLGNLESEKAKEEIIRSNEYKRIKNNIAIASKELIKLRKAVSVYNGKRIAFKRDIKSAS